ncbi:MAG: hypothetical protein K9M51_01560 [Candidatus Gracilibacteria bacterium]|nr:hypothetical protein [Candidatus Gracilibacteria bacterium]
MRKYVQDINPMTPEEFREELRRVFKEDYGANLTEEELIHAANNLESLLKNILSWKISTN